MPNIKSAITRARKTKKQTLINRVRKSKYKITIKKMMAYIDAKNTTESKKFLPEFHSQLMKIAKTGVVNKKTASRKISRISKKIYNLNKKK
jgi:small subunit ribosomal protein S20